MGMKQRLTQKAGELERKNSGASGWHSTFYQSYFAGYTEYYVKKPDGTGRKLERVYTGTYYSQALSGRARVLIRLLYAVLFALAMVLFFPGANAAGSAWYVTLCTAAVVPFAFLSLMSLVYYLFARMEMKQYEYQKSTVLKKYTAVSAVFMTASAALAIVNGLRGGSPEIPWISAAMLAGSALCMAAISILERHIQYNKRLSREEAPPGGIEIGCED